MAGGGYSTSRSQVQLALPLRGPAPSCLPSKGTHPLRNPCSNPTPSCAEMRGTAPCQVTFEIAGRDTLSWPWSIIAGWYDWRVTVCRLVSRKIRSGSPLDAAPAKQVRDGGGGGIRTHGRVAPTPVFKTGAFGHSATPPYHTSCEPAAHYRFIATDAAGENHQAKSYFSPVESITFGVNSRRTSFSKSAPTRPCKIARLPEAGPTRPPAGHSQESRPGSVPRPIRSRSRCGENHSCRWRV